MPGESSSHPGGGDSRALERIGVGGGSLSTEGATCVNSTSVSRVQGQELCP